MFSAPVTYQVDTRILMKVVKCMEIKQVMVIGAGQMGNGIAQVFAQSGYNVYLNDIKEEFVQKGLDTIDKNLDRLVKKEKISADDKAEVLGRITSSTNYEDAKNCQLVVEAATENPAIKFDIFKQLDELTSEETILASNTSSISITSIGAATNRPDKVVGLHFFNPVPVMKLIEVNRGLLTSDETLQAMKQVGESLNKTVVEVKDSAGFVVNRILVPMINEAIFVLSEGISTAEEIDEAMKLGANHPMGPIALADYIGLDVVLAVMNTLYDEFKDSKYRPAPLLGKYVEAGHLGRKTGRGFYDYTK